MKILQWPEQERPREKLLARGADALSDAELLAIVFRVGAKGQNAVDLARTLLNEFGGLQPLLDADASQVLATKGVGHAKYVQLQACLALARRYFRSSIGERDLLNSSRCVKVFLTQQLRHFTHEVFAVVWLDAKHRMIEFEVLFTGSISSTAVHPRIIVQKALIHNAAAAILSHNHPSGDPSPSAADKQMTRIITQALALIDVNVIDHIVVGNEACASFAEEGLIRQG